jgi:hypothetical protein
MRSRVENQVIPGIAVDAANQKFGRFSDEGLPSWGRPLLPKMLASTYVIALSQPSALDSSPTSIPGLPSSEISNIRLTQFG